MLRTTWNSTVKISKFTPKKEIYEKFEEFLFKLVWRVWTNLVASMLYTLNYKYLQQQCLWAKMHVVWANFALCSNCVWGSQAQYYPHSYKWSKEGPGPISSVRANEYPRTTSRGMDKITIRGEEEHACDELGRVRRGWSPRYFCQRYLMNSLITQNNAWDKSYNRAKGEISNKK